MARRVNQAKKLDDVIVATDAIANRITKTDKHESPDVTVLHSPSCWGLHDGFDGRFDIVKELPAKAAALLIEVARCLDQLNLEGRVKPTFHKSLARALRNTSACVFGGTDPLAISSARARATESAFSSSSSASRRRTSSRSPAESFGNSARISALLMG